MEKIIKEYNIYEFDELKEEVKKELIERERGYQQQNYIDFMLSDDMGSKAGDLINDYFGITSDYLKTYYSLCYCQGDGAMVEFDINIVDLNNKYEVFSDEEMRFLTDENVVNKVIIKHNNNSRYYHEYTFTTDSDYYNNWNYDEIKDKYEISEEQFDTIDSRFYDLLDRKSPFIKDIIRMNMELSKYGYECIEYFGECDEKEIINYIKDNDNRYLESGEVFYG